MNPLTRRKALTALAVAPAAMMAPPAAAAPANNVHALIEAHRAAMARLHQAIDRMVETDERFDEEWDRNMVLVPTAILPDGKHVGPYCDIRLNERRQLVKGINDHYKTTLVGCGWMRTAIPAQAKVAEATLRSMRRRALVYIKQAEAMLEEREDKAGVTAADEAYHAASKVELDTRVRLVLAHPQTDSEIKAKADYLSSCVPMRDGWNDSEFADAVVRHCGVEV